MYSGMWCSPQKPRFYTWQASSGVLKVLPSQLYPMDYCKGNCADRVHGLVEDDMVWLAWVCSVSVIHHVCCVAPSAWGVTRFSFFLSHDWSDHFWSVLCFWSSLLLKSVNWFCLFSHVKNNEKYLKLYLSHFSLLLTPGEGQVHEWNDSRCHITLLESHTIVFHKFNFVTFNFLKTCCCVFWQTPQEIFFYFYRCTVHFEDSLSITHQQMH